MSNSHETEIPGAPSADEIRAEIERTALPAFWRPHGPQDGTATDLSGLSEREATRLLEARYLTGPGPSANALQREIHSQALRKDALVAERNRLADELSANRSYDPVTGEGISMVSPERAKGITDRLSEINDELSRIAGVPGQLALEKALAKAVADRQAAYRAEYVQAEAKRRAASDALEADIERAAEGFRKVLPRW